MVAHLRTLAWGHRTLRPDSVPRFRALEHNTTPPPANAYSLHSLQGLHPAQHLRRTPFTDCAPPSSAPGGLGARRWGRRLSLSTRNAIQHTFNTLSTHPLSLSQATVPGRGGMEESGKHPAAAKSSIRARRSAVQPICHIRLSRPASVLDFQVNALKTFQVDPSWLGSGRRGGGRGGTAERGQWPAAARSARRVRRSPRERSASTPNRARDAPAPTCPPDLQSTIFRRIRK